jgi:predicted Fe-S protein YdhL (DUF1289 family)
MYQITKSMTLVNEKTVLLSLSCHLSGSIGLRSVCCGRPRVKAFCQWQGANIPRGCMRAADENSRGHFASDGENLPSATPMATATGAAKRQTNRRSEQART